MTIKEAREKLKNDKLTDQQIADILERIHLICGRAVDKAIKKNNGKN